MIELRHLSKKFGKKMIYQDVNLKFEQAKRMH